MLVVITNRNFLPAIARNKIYVKKLNDLGFNPSQLDLSNTFRLFYNRLFKLAPKLEAKYDAFSKRAKPTPTTKLICAQIRIGGKFYDRTLWKDVTFQTISNAQLYWRLIREKLIPIIGVDGFVDEFDDYRIFLTTDNENVHRSFLSEFGSEKLVYNEGSFNHIDMINYSEDPNNCEPSEKSVLDFHALQLCDAAVITNTQFGSFGMLLRPNPTKEVYSYDTEIKQFVQMNYLEQYTAV